MFYLSFHFLNAISISLSSCKGRWNGGRDSVKAPYRTFGKAIRMVHGTLGALTRCLDCFNMVDAEFLAPAGAHDRIEKFCPTKEASSIKED